MSDTGKSFELGGVVVPWRAALDHDQQIEAIGAMSTVRLLDGSAVRQTAWRGKLRVTLSGSGWTPLGLSGLDYTQAMTLKCAIPETVQSAVAAITLPAARRTDSGYAPFAQAHMADGSTVDTSVSVVGDVATCTAISGAIGYSVWYWPQLTVFADEPTRTGSAGTGDFGWQIVCEEQ